MHGFCNLGRAGPLDFKAKPPASSNNREIQFGTGMCCPKKAFLFASAQPPDNLLEHKAFPRGAYFRVTLKIFKRSQIKQGMQDTCVSEVYFRRFDLTFRDILLPGQ